jgi:hypothetical protein
VHVRLAFGEPIDVGTIYDGTKSKKLQSIMSVTDRMRSDLETLLENLIIQGSMNVVPVMK